MSSNVRYSCSLASLIISRNFDFTSGDSMVSGSAGELSGDGVVACASASGVDCSKDSTNGGAVVDSSAGAPAAGFLLPDFGGAASVMAFSLADGFLAAVFFAADFLAAGFLLPDFLAGAGVDFLFGLLSAMVRSGWIGGKWWGGLANELTG